MRQQSEEAERASPEIGTAMEGLRGLVEDALLRPQTVAYATTMRVVLVSILTSVVVMAVETVHPLVDEYKTLFAVIDVILLTIFTVEYVANVWVAPNRRGYLLSAWGVIDLLAIAPAYIEFALGGMVGAAFLRQLRTLRVMRTLRVLKLLKLAAEQVQKSTEGAAKRRNTFAADLQIYAICLFTVVSISSSLIHLAEAVPPGVPETTSEMFAALKDAEEGKAPAPEWAADPMVTLYQERSGKGWSTPVYTFTSVPKSYWWSVVTLTTTGYGDMFPVTGFGRIVGGLTMLAGLALFSLLTSVVGRALMTSLFGRAEESDKAKSFVYLLSPRVPSGFDATRTVRDLQAARTLAMQTPTEFVGILERPLYGSDSAISDIKTSTQHVASVIGSVAAGLDKRDHDPNRPARPSWFDTVVRASFADVRSPLYKPVHNALTIAIFGSVLLVVLDSVSWFHEAYQPAIDAIEIVLVLFFTFEFAANYHLTERKRDYLFSVWGVIDILAILPTYLTIAIFATQVFGIPVDLNAYLIKVLRMMRVLRMLRTLKLVRTAAANMQLTLSGSKKSSFWSDLQIYLIALFTVLVIASTLIWHVEFDPNDENSTTMFVDIPTSMWWGIVTLCTVGYGDMFPQTFMGRIIGGATMIAGLALFGILTSVIGRALMASLFGSDGSGEVAEPEVVHFEAPELHDVYNKDDHLGALVRRGLLSPTEAVEIARREPAPSA
jgi:voltage-gated potassium channel